MMYKYEHGGDIYTEKLTKDGRPFVDYSANINPLGLPLGIKQAVQQALKLCINYPDPLSRAGRGDRKLSAAAAGVHFLR